MALTTEELKKIHVGQNVFVVESSRRQGIEGAGREATIVKIANKYFYTSDDKKWEIKTGANVSEFGTAQLFISQKDFNDKKELDDLWRLTYQQLTLNRPKDMSLETLKQVRELVGFPKQVN